MSSKAVWLLKEVYSDHGAEGPGCRYYGGTDVSMVESPWLNVTLKAIWQRSTGIQEVRQTSRLYGLDWFYDIVMGMDLVAGILDARIYFWSNL